MNQLTHTSDRLEVGKVVQVRDDGVYGFVRNVDTGHLAMVHIADHSRTIFSGERGLWPLVVKDHFNGRRLRQDEVIRYKEEQSGSGLRAVLWVDEEEYVMQIQQMYDHRMTMEVFLGPLKVEDRVIDIRHSRAS